MTPQQKAALPSGTPDGASTEWNMKMKPTVQRRRSTSSALSRALSRSRSHSRERIFSPSHPHNGLLSEPSPAFILYDPVQLTLGLQTQERHLLLFNTNLVVAKPKSSTTLKLKKQVTLSEVWTSSCLSEVSEKKLSPETSFVIGWPTCNYVATFSSPEVKQRWLSILLWHINEMKDRELPKSLPMQITWMDGDLHSSNIVLQVSNLEMADGAVKMATQQLGLPGRPSDYHLWVIPGSDKSAYPLIGHEHPFSIILSCLRKLVGQIQGSQGNPLLVDEYETLLLDQFPRDRQCRFLLKPKPQAPGHLHRDALQKRTRRKKSLINWALRRNSGTPMGSPASQSPTNPRKLFGLSLTSVCPDGSLPKPIMDILQLLYHEGPSTRGIFRRSANAKVCKELKEKLNSGDDVQVDGESAFVAAAVITDFLRNIPDSVLSSDMHGLWMEAIEKENRVHKIEAIKRLVDKLPKANHLLLRYFFGVLHHIQQNAIENQMNAFNLALCIAPNMLWLPSPMGPEEESKSTKKVAMLVQFLIENSVDIFGGDVASLFQRPEKNKSKIVDDLLAQHNDSSDDMEYATSYQERAKQHYDLDTDEVLYSPSGELFLTKDQEDWDLFSEITTCYKSKTGKNASADSYELLEEEEEGSFCSIGSLCSLNPARNRCSSEPSVCLSSQLLPPEHEPVARQSSCDATIMHSHGDYIRRLKELQQESQKLLDEGLSPSLSRARKTFWISPPQITSLAKKSGPLMMSLSNRSSFSSLSSTTTTSPSASSLSSLDSAFSYCSESSTFSPTEGPSQPFMFSTSARLQALSPLLAKRSLKEWHKPLVSPLPLSSSQVDFCIGEQEDGSGSSRGEEKIFMPVGTVGSPADEDNWGQDKKEPQSSEMLSHHLGSSSFIKGGSMDPSPVDEASPLASQQVQREKSVKHIEIKCPESDPSSQGNLKRTKITIYMAPKERVPCREEEQDPATTDGQPGSGSLSPSVPKSLQAIKVHIPQTVFYGQNTPLVLKSTSRKYQRHDSVNQTSEVVVVPQSPLLGEQPDSASRQEGSHLESKMSSSTFSHTFRLFLPSSVRKTVREYFSHEASKESVTAEMETVENELIRTKGEWLRSGSCPPRAPTEEHQGLMYAKQAFV